ncbi:MAG TPA: hypothetical protein ENI55_04390 [Alphaproteobacteria bacterium]|nr:hypothetical protein [Alphaproteobacteria bacterium]
MKIIRAAVLAILIPALPPFQKTAAAETSCPKDNGTTDLSVSQIIGEVTYKTGNTRSDLKRIQQRHGKMATASGWFPLGLTLSELRVEMRISTRAYPTGQGRYCAVPASVDIDLGYPKFTIYVDRRYRRGSCEYRAISEHEERHVAIYQNRLDRLISWVRESMAREISRIKPVIAVSPGDGAEKIKRRLGRKLAPLIKRLQRATDAGNREIDSRTSYVRVQRRCRNW